MKRALTLAALLSAAAFTLAGCAEGFEVNSPPSHPQSTQRWPDLPSKRQRPAKGQQEVTGKGWVEDGGRVTSRQLELVTRKYASRDINVSKAVYDACDLGELYPSCAKGVAS